MSETVQMPSWTMKLGAGLVSLLVTVLTMYSAHRFEEMTTKMADLQSEVRVSSSKVDAVANALNARIYDEARERAAVDSKIIERLTRVETRMENE